MDYVESIKLYALITCCTCVTLIKRVVTPTKRAVTPTKRARRLINSPYTVCAGIININSTIYTDSRH